MDELDKDYASAASAMSDRLERLIDLQFQFEDGRPFPHGALICERCDFVILDSMLENITEFPAVVSPGERRGLCYCHRSPLWLVDANFSNKRPPRLGLTVVEEYDGYDGLTQILYG